MNPPKWQFLSLDHIECIKDSQAIFFDSEFVREYAYYPLPSLFQLCQHQGEEVFLYDVKKAHTKNNHALFHALTHHPAPFVIHSGAQDLEILHALSDNHLPDHVQDTQLGFALCYPNQRISLANMVQHYLGFTPQKSQTTSDWLQRPLSQEQLIYACDDVRLLASIYPLLLDDLKRLDRMHWWEEENQHLKEEVRTPRTEFAWYRLKDAPRLLHGKARIYAQMLVHVREVIAQMRNLPRQQILKDAILIRHAQKHQGDTLIRSGLGEQLLALHPHWDLDDIHQKEKSLLQEKLTQPPRAIHITPVLKKRLHRLKTFTAQVAEELNIHPDFLASKNQMVRHLTQPEKNSRLNTGWRGAIFTHFKG